MEILPLLEDLHKLVVGGWNSLVPADSRPPQQHVVRSATATNDVELVHRPYRSYNQLKVNVANSKLGRTFEAQNFHGLLRDPIPRHSCGLKDG